MKPKAIFILGLSRVGSTLLDLTLGSHSPFVGLGEVFQLIRPDFNRFKKKAYCSCGKVIDECPFWGVATDRLKKNQDANLSERYQLVFETFYEIFGRESILIDSSKLLYVLPVFLQNNNVDVKVIYLIRDVRAWTVSRLNNRLQSPEHFKKHGNYYKKLLYHYGWRAKMTGWMLPFLTQRSSYYFWLWYYQNKKINKFLIDQNIDYFGLGYDEIGLMPDIMIPEIFKYLGENIKTGDFSSQNSQSHIIVGNTRKNDTKRRKGIVYDYRWMYQNDWLLPAAFFQNIMKYNSTHVYRNLQNYGFWK